MKKLFCLILAFVLLLSVPIASASSMDNLYKRTEPCLITEFEGLAMYRFILNYQKIYNVSDLRPNYIQLLPYSDFPSLDSFFGLIEADKDDLLLKSVSMEVDVDAKSDKFFQNIYVCTSAISALEFDGSDDSRLAISYKAGLSEYASAFDAALGLYSDTIFPNIIGIIKKNPPEHTQFSVYSGCYNYFVSISNISGTRRIYLTATAK